jgi:Exocyst complex component Sec10
VDMVVDSRFPELFNKAEASEHSNHSDDSDEDDEDKFDMDSTRSKLSSLFHRVSEVCTAEFELIAYVFGSEGSRTDLLDGSEEMPLVVARALLQRVISDPHNGLQGRINDLLASVDRQGDFDTGAKKLDTFVVIHEKAAGLFSLLKEAADKMIPEDDSPQGLQSPTLIAARTAVESLKGFLTSQELALSNTHRQGYINLELRLLHHDCCSSLDHAGCTLVKGPPPRPDRSLAEKGILEEYRAPCLPLYKEALVRSGYNGILAGPLKQSVLRQSLIHATDSLARARLMFGTSKRGGETTSRVILSIYNQMCTFYGQGFLYPIVETLREMLPSSPPAQPPSLPFDEEVEAPDLGVSPAFWVALERVHSAAKSFDRELWAENREGSQRAWEILNTCGDATSIAVARDCRLTFYSELERRGDNAILRALDTLSTHVQWVLVTGGESMMATGGTRIFNQLTGQGGGPYAIPAGSSLDTPNSPAVKSLTYCLRVQFVHVQAALTPQSLAGFWTALSMRLYDILVARLLQHYSISTVGAVILSRDVEALRSVAMLAGSEHAHWDLLRELLTLYMTPPDAIRTMLLGPEGDSSKGLFAKAGREQALVFLSRRNDFRYKTASGPKKSSWVTDLLAELNIADPSDSPINIGLFAAGRKG